MGGYLLLTLTGLCLSMATGCARQDARLNILPATPLKELELKKRERPRPYTLITDTNVLEQAGVRANPGYLARRVDREALVRVGAVASFIALYGTEDTVRLMVKGVYFHDPEFAHKYVEIQETRLRLVAGFRRDTRDGIWLLFIAGDPELTYTNDEKETIRRGLQRYQRRLKLETLFDHFTAPAAE